MPGLATAQDPNAATLTFGLANVTLYFRLLMAAPEQTREAQISVRHIAGGNVNYVDIGGLLPSYIRGQALFSSMGDFVNMRDNAVGQLGTLTYAEATYPVYLTKISRQKVPSNKGYMIATLEFLINL